MGKLKDIFYLLGIGISFVLLFIIISTSNQDFVEARTPPDYEYGLSKPDDLLIHLPFEPGTSSHLGFYSYGSPGSSHFKADYYAIDFDLNGDKTSGDLVYPVAPGKVIFSEDGHHDGYGNAIIIQHSPDFANYVSIYAHLDSRLVEKYQSVSINTPIGKEGKSGGQDTVHLHFAMRYCENPSDRENIYGNYPNCQPVVPEPFLGVDVYEGLGWWHTLYRRGAHQELVTSASRPVNDTSTPTGYWNTAAVANGTTISPGDPVVFDVHYEDAQNEIGEIRLTAFYNVGDGGWAAQNGSWGSQGLSDFDSTKVWRIIARCDPYRASPDSNCGQNNWRFSWDPYTDTGFPSGVQDNNFLGVPWLPKALVPAREIPIDVCVSFDIFDRAGNPLYSPGGTQCNFGIRKSTVENNNEINASTFDNQARLIRIMPLSSNLSSSCAATFISDVTLPDNTIVSPNQSLVKTWRVRNSGSTTWGSGYQLVFQSGDQMQAPNAVDLPNAVPGETVNISVNLTAPGEGGDYRGNWRLRNPQGTYFGDELWVQIRVPDASQPTPPPDGESPIELTCTNCPAGVAPGETFRPTIRATVNSGQLLGSRGDMLRNTDGNLYGAWQHVAVSGAAYTGQTYDFTFYADNPIIAPGSAGTYESKWRVWRDGNWVGDEFTIRFKVETSGSTNYAPHSPSLTGPGDWAVYEGNEGITLEAQHNGDPDGDSVTHYYFEIFESAQNVNSGWITSNSWSPQGLGFNGYQWRAKVRDSQGNESDWSDEVWHFTVENDATTIYEFYSINCSDIGGNPEKLCFCADTNAGTLKLQINTASDGSANGEWNVINQLGVPDYNCTSADDHPPNLDPLPYEAGTHKVRLYARGDGGWENAAHADITINLPADRKPDGPGLREPDYEAYLDSQTVHFDWDPTLRTTGYRLEASASSDYSTLLIDETFSADTTEYVHTFSSDYETIYWRVTANGPYGSNRNDWHFHIDVDAPSSSTSALEDVTTDTKFSINWNGSDARSGVRWYHVQVRSDDRPGEEWKDWLVNTKKTAEMFQAQPGHNYCFRVRAMDDVGNWEAWPAGDGDTCTLVDPSAMPSTAWWNGDYYHKRNLIILNNDGHTMPTGFPVHLHFDSTTTPSAAEVYHGLGYWWSGKDLRVVYNNTTEIPRFLQNFSETEIDIWFPLQSALGGGNTSSGNYQIYYGTDSAISDPPDNVNDVFLPKADSNTMGLWHFQESSGTTVNDSSGRGHNGSFVDGGWGDGYLGYAGNFNGTSSVVDLGHHADFDNINAMTLEAWIYLAEAKYHKIIMKGKDGYNQYYLGINGDQKVEFIIDAESGNDHLGVPEQLNTNQWYHVAGVYDGQSNMRIYINGEKKAELDDSGPLKHRDDGLYIGNATWWNDMAFSGYIQHVRISNIARTNFPYAKVNIPPSVEAGIEVDPPSTGNPELAILDVNTYPNLEGGMLVQARVENRGDAATQNNFYTDLYADHLPTGAGDYTGSLRFWVNAPIQAGATVTLTTVITDLMNGGTRQPLMPREETTATLYAQVDSMGVVSETDNLDNISAGTDICLANADVYESNDTIETAQPILLDEIQSHNMDRPSDQDWVKFDAQGGVTYTLRTLNLSQAADTYLYLYDTDGTTLLASNDDYSGTLASRIDWVAPADGTYYLLIHHWNPNVGGCGTSYDLTFEEHAQDSMVSIADARTLDNGEITKVQGDVSVPIDVFSYNEFWLQDVTGGLAVYSVSPDNIQLGDRVEVIGEMDEYEGKKEVIPSTVGDVRLIDRGVPPDPIVIDTANIDENSEGWLVAVKGTVSGIGGNPFTLNDGSGATNIYFDDTTGIDTSGIEDGDMLSLVGVSSQYDPSAPYDSGYQVLPRYQYDIAQGNVMPIALARQQSEGDIVTVQGAVTALPGTFEDITLNRELYIQDGTAGIDVYNHDGLPIPAGTLSMGDIVTITGELFSYNGRMELIATEAAVQGFKAPIEPKIQLAGNINELTEGLLVVVTGTVSSKSSSGFDLTDHSGTTAVYIDGDIDIDLNGINDGDTLRVVGLSAQYDTDAPYDSGYQIMIRTQDDLEIVSPPTSEIPLTDVSITGPLTGTPGASYTFTATAQPVTATQPIQYIWDAQQQISETHEGSHTDTITYAWDTLGYHTITVTANNVGSTVVATHTIKVYNQPHLVLIDNVYPRPPYCVVRESDNPYDRLLELSGENFTFFEGEGLNFRRTDTGDTSIYFGMEVNWESDNRVTVDMADIKHLLWSDERITMTARFANAGPNHEPLSSWSPEFVLADTVTVCGKTRPQPPQADFTANPTSGHVPLMVNFSNQSTGDYNTCTWEFGDGGISAKCNNVSYIYEKSDSYIVRLTVEGDSGLDIETKLDYITVAEANSIFLPLVLRD